MRKILSSLLALLVTVTLFAAPRTVEEAAAIAARFTNSQPQLSRMHKAPRKAADMKLAHKALQNNSEAAAFYVFNQENANGFVIVSADDRTAEDVLGYTENGSFDYKNINPNLKFWLNRYAEEITVLQNIDDSEFINEPQARKAKQVTAIPNLLVNDQGYEITWYQETPYNDYCPIDQRDQTRSLTGCVATATSAVMYKWRHPASGHGTHSYTWYNCKNDNCSQYWTKTVTSNFDTVAFNWANMLPAYEGISATAAQKKAIASLMYNVGVAAKMQYGGDANEGSGAWTDDMAYGLITYFDYQIDKFVTMYSSKSDYEDAKGTNVANVTAEYGLSSAQITSYFNADLEAGRPIVMGGEDSSGGGHEFVCCGRDANNKFYINWGWEGTSNGYYAITSLKPSGYSYNFSTHLDAIIGLRPAADPFEITWMADGEEFTKTTSTGSVVLPASTPEACESGKVFVGWTATADYEHATTAPTFVKAGNAVSEGAIFYAVYATLEGGGSSMVTFTPGTDTGETSVTKDNITCTMTTMNNDSYYQIYANESGTFSCSTGNITKIEFTCTASGKDKYGPGNASADGGNYSYSGDKGTWTGDAASVTISSTKQIRMTTLSITAGSGSYSDYSTSCGAPAEKYAITINPSTNGSLATSPSTEAAAGRKVTVTATPATHYQLATLTVKDADDATVAVSGEGNVRTFTMPAKAVTISGTFEEQAKVTVRFFDKGQQISSAQYFIGETAQKPANPIPSCDAYTFVGWWTAELPANNKDAKAWITNFTVTEAKDYYAIYSLTEDGGSLVPTNTYKKITSESELSTANYIVVGYYNSGYYAMKNEVYSNYYVAQQEVTPSSDIITTNDEGIIWEITVNGDNLSFYNEEIGKYLYILQDNTHYNLKFTSETSGIYFTYAVNSGSWEFISTTYTDRYMQYYGSKSDFSVYTTAGDPIYLYKQQVEISGTTYYSSVISCGGTTIENNTIQPETNKILRNGQVLIIRDGKIYNVLGVPVQ
ncbi:MAG: C10 family peptidase [Paludibacteraceae bacterium]|nr:C10 family peptidase [Paludibacteraceae bacterium]